MNRKADTITETDLQAYVDDELLADCQIEVESYLRCHMAEAAWVTAELQTRDELRMALAESLCTPRGTTIDAAWRLERALIRDRTIRGLWRLAAVVAAAGLGWLAHAQLGKVGISQVLASARPPAYATDAAVAHRAPIVRANLRSPSCAAAYGPAKTRAATAVVMPTLPQGWKVMT
jgi:anti-sigma factor RsiW